MIQMTRTVILILLLYTNFIVLIDEKYGGVNL